jgi:hypothetical protein
MHATSISALTLAVMFAAGAAQANTTLTFQQGVNGYLGTADTTLMSSDNNFAHGTDTAASIDASDGGSPNHVLLRFDDLFGNGAGQIKATDSIVSATVTLVTDSYGSGLLAHDMLVAWDEATATWNSFGNGIQTDGTEAAAVAFATLGANSGGTNVATDTFSIDVTASLQAAQAGSLPGYGWALMPWMPDGTNGLDFITKEGFLAADRPLLSVEVAPVPEPETYALMLAGLGLVGFAARKARRA